MIFLCLFSDWQDGLHLARRLFCSLRVLARIAINSALQSASGDFGGVGLSLGLNERAALGHSVLQRHRIQHQRAIAAATPLFVVRKVRVVALCLQTKTKQICKNDDFSVLVLVKYLSLVLEHALTSLTPVCFCFVQRRQERQINKTTRKRTTVRYSKKFSLRVFHNKNDPAHQIRCFKPPKLRFLTRLTSKLELMASRSASLRFWASRWRCCTSCTRVSSRLMRRAKRCLRSLSVSHRRQSTALCRECLQVASSTENKSSRVCLALATDLAAAFQEDFLKNPEQLCFFFFFEPSLASLRASFC